MSQFYIEDQTFDDVLQKNYHVSIFASGYEKRSRYFLSKIYKTILPSISVKLCLQFVDYSHLHDRVVNDALFKKNGFDFYKADESNYGELSAIISTAIGALNEDVSEELNVLVDYTVMRRTWYSELLQYFQIFPAKKVCLTFVYTCGSYMGTKQLKVVDDYLLVPGFEGVGSRSKDKYGIYSLGFEPVSVHSLHDWVEPRAVTCLIANPGSKATSRDTCYRLNKEFIDLYGYDLIETPLHLVRSYCNHIIDIIKQRSADYDIVLFGGGPKPFVLGNFLCSLLRPKTSNIYLKGPESDPVNVESTGSLVVTEVVFHNS